MNKYIKYILLALPILFGINYFIKDIPIYKDIIDFLQLVDVFVVGGLSLLANKGVDEIKVDVEDIKDDFDLQKEHATIRHKLDWQKKIISKSPPSHDEYKELKVILDWYNANRNFVGGAEWADETTWIERHTGRYYNGIFSLIVKGLKTKGHERDDMFISMPAEGGTSRAMHYFYRDEGMFLIWVMNKLNKDDNKGHNTYKGMENYDPTEYLKTFDSRFIRLTKHLKQYNS